MTINREHLAGLELALKTINAEGYMTGQGCRDHIRAMIAQAQAAPEAEPVEVVAWRYERYICGNSYSKPTASLDQPYSTDRNVEPLMAVAQHNRIMASAPQHDAELVELIEELIDVDDGGLDDYWREHAGKELMGRIDAKLATLRHV